MSDSDRTIARYLAACDPRHDAGVAVLWVVIGGTASTMLGVVLTSGVDTALLMYVPLFVTWTAIATFLLSSYLILPGVLNPDE